LKIGERLGPAFDIERREWIAMRIGIYVDVAKADQPSGIGYHILHLLRALSDLDQANEYYLYYQCGLWQNKNVFPHCPRQLNFRCRPVRAPASCAEEHPTLWWNYYLPFLLKVDGIDVFHGPSHMLPAISRKKTVLTIHDIAHFSKELYSPEMSRAIRHWTKLSLERAGRVIALSENTRRDLEGIGVESERLRVIYGGGNVVAESQIPLARADEVRRAYGLPERYVLFVGTINPRKNVPFLLRSFAQLKRDRSIPHSLVLVGKKDSASDEVECLIRELGIESDVRITGYVEEWQVPLFYKMADLFVLPTLYEGFTLVTLEAMAYGVPVVATDTSSIREGVGDAALLVQLEDVDGLAQAIRTALIDPCLRRRLIERGKVQSQQFTWERCARQTLDLYQELYKETQCPIASPSEQVPTACGNSR
jgi:glycosyltransferase involved in cell wall biosynthesis